MLILLLCLEFVDLLNFFVLCKQTKNALALCEKFCYKRSKSYYKCMIYRYESVPDNYISYCFFSFSDYNFLSTPSL